MEFSVTRCVAFSETDASGRVHFTEILKWVEDAEHQFLKERKIPICSPESGWPRVNVQCDYRAPLHFGDEVVVNLTLMRIGKSSLTWSFEIQDSQSAVAAEGSLVTVFVLGGKAGAVIPTEIRSRLESASC